MRAKVLRLSPNEEQETAPAAGPSSENHQREKLFLSHDRWPGTGTEQVIDEYSNEMSAFLRHAAGTAGVFQPLQPHPDIDSSSSSSRNAVRDDQSTRAQGWSETVDRVREGLSDQLSIRPSEQGHGTTPAGPSHHDQGPHL